MMTSKWTPDEETALRRGYASGRAVCLIAFQLNRSKNSVISRAWHLGLVHNSEYGKRAHNVEAPETARRTLRLKHDSLRRSVRKQGSVARVPF